MTEIHAAVDQYLTQRASELTEQTLQTYEYRLNQFIVFCADQDNHTIGDITAGTIYEYRQALSDKTDSNATIAGHCTALRPFIRYCSHIGPVNDHLCEIITAVTPTKLNARDTTLNAETATEILNWHEEFAYSSRDHLLLTLCWELGLRMGGVRAIDCTDVQTDTGDQYIELVHRPDTDTPLKQGTDGERLVNISPSTVGIIDAYRTYRRRDVTDDYGREPLVTTHVGRISRDTISRTIHQATRPCYYTGGDCPHGREQDECDAWTDSQNARACPSSVSPHDVRRGSITHHLNSDIPKRIVADKMNVSEDVLDEHYDARSERDKMKLRREYMDTLR